MITVFNTVKAIGYKNGDAPRLTSDICLVRDEALDMILSNINETVWRSYEGTDTPDEEIEARADELVEDAEFVFGEGGEEWRWNTEEKIFIWQLKKVELPTGLEEIFGGGDE
jgi:hypothetical protein